MPLSTSAIKEIDTELATLHRLQAEINDRIATLEAAKKPFQFGQAAQTPLPLRAANGHGGRVSETASVSPSASTNNGLRAAIIDVLREEGPKRAPEIAVVLETRGFSAGSTTPLSTRIYNDLWRLRKKDLVVGKKGGVFELK
jgi:hypothetical protein